MSDLSARLLYCGCFCAVSEDCYYAWVEFMCFVSVIGCVFVRVDVYLLWCLGFGCDIVGF